MSEVMLKPGRRLSCLCVLVLFIDTIILEVFEKSAWKVPRGREGAHLGIVPGANKDTQDGPEQITHEPQNQKEE